MSERDEYSLIRSDRDVPHALTFTGPGIGGTFVPPTPSEPTP